MEENAFKWVPQPKAELFILNTVTNAIVKSQFLKELENKLFTETSTRLLDWVDHIEVGYSDEVAKDLEAAGFAAVTAAPQYRVYVHPGAKLPLVVVKDQAHPFVGISIAVESIADFLMCRGMSCEIEGSSFSAYRRACVSKEQGVFVYVVERRGCLSMEPTIAPVDELNKIFAAYEKWQTRPRDQNPDGDEEGLLQAINIAEEMVESVGAGMASWIVLDVERRFWQAKNTAGQIQKNRQDRLGMGWANHDHHTFRSSRKSFRFLVRLFEILGFTCRERFYAGAEAGWGAQVMEQKESRLVLFLDVDLSPQEIDGDFAHNVLDERKELGTIGLWCALHGESILQSGMHHLEAQFDFDKLHSDLIEKGVGVMAPFTNLPHLRQAFTVGEQWKVDNRRLDHLLQLNLITQEQATRFKEKGALGSHLENLERKHGFKGFNQKSVSDIIHRTDPRGA